MESNRNSSFGFAIRMFRDGDLKSPGSMRSDYKSARTMGKLWIFVLLLFVACSPKTQETKEKAQGDNLMRHARNISVYVTDYGYRMEVICPWDTTLSLGSFAIIKDTTAVVDKDVKGVLKAPVQSVISFSDVMNS